MSKKINVRGVKEIDDPCYRYKMEAVSVVVQKTKCVISNLGVVGADLERDPLMLVEYLKKKLGGCHEI